MLPLISPLLTPTLLSTLQNSQLREHRADRLIWKPAKRGCFSFSSAYREVRQVRGEAQTLKRIWNTHIQKKVSIFMWRLLNMQLPFDDVLQFYKFNLASKCIFCDNCDSIDHFYNACHFSLKIWKEILGTIAVIDSDFDSAWNRISFYLSFSGFTKLHSTVVQNSACFLCWVLWKAKNKFLFEGTKVSHFQIIKEVKEHIFYSFVVKPVYPTSCFDLELVQKGVLPHMKKPPKPRIFTTSWKRPAHGVKLNVDASWCSISTGIGCIIRDIHGNFKNGKCFFTKTKSPLEAEILAIKLGIIFTQSLGFTDVTIESDCLNAVSMVLNPITAHWKLFELCDDTEMLINNCTIKHCLREANQVADCMSKMAQEIKQELQFHRANLPQRLSGLIALDKQEVPSIRISSQHYPRC